MERKEVKYNVQLNLLQLRYLQETVAQAMADENKNQHVLRDINFELHTAVSVLPVDNSSTLKFIMDSLIPTEELYETVDFKVSCTNSKTHQQVELSLGFEATSFNALYTALSEMEDEGI